MIRWSIPLSSEDATHSSCIVWPRGVETERERDGWSECNTEVKWFSNDWGLKSNRTPSRKPPRDVFPLPGRGLTSPGMLPESHPTLHMLSVRVLLCPNWKNEKCHIPVVLSSKLLSTSLFRRMQEKNWRKLKVTHSFRVARSAFLNTSTVCSLLKAHLECVCSRGCLLHSNEKRFGLRFNPALLHSIHVWPRTRLQLLTCDGCHE